MRRPAFAKDAHESSGRKGVHDKDVPCDHISAQNEILAHHRIPWCDDLRSATPWKDNGDPMGLANGP